MVENDPLPGTLWLNLTKYTLIFHTEFGSLKSTYVPPGWEPLIVIGGPINHKRSVHEWFCFLLPRGQGIAWLERSVIDAHLTNICEAEP